MSRSRWRGPKITYRLLFHKRPNRGPSDERSRTVAHLVCSRCRVHLGLDDRDPFKEMTRQLGEHVKIRLHFISVCGDSRNKMQLS